MPACILPEIELPPTAQVEPFVSAGVFRVEIVDDLVEYRLYEPVIAGERGVD